MTNAWGCWSKRAAVAVVLMVATGCGSGPNETVAPTKGGASAFGVAEVPSEFGVYAATASDRLAVGVVDQPYSSDETSTFVGVDLADGEVVEFAGPLDDGAPVAVEQMATDGQALAGAGARCTSPTGGEGCAGSQVIVRLDPDALQWTVVAVPEDAAGMQLDAVYVLDGDVLLVESGIDSTSIRRLSHEGTWSTVADLPSESRPATCIADGALWLFRVNRSESTEPAATDTGYRLTRLELDDGEAQEIELPALAGYFGGVTVPFGCNSSGPVVATTPPGEVPAPDADRDAMNAALTGITAWHRRGSEWQAIEGEALVGATVAGEIISGPDGAVIRGAEMSQSDGPNRPIVIVADPSGRTSEVDTTGDDAFLWRGTTGHLIWVYDNDSGRALTVVEVES